MSCWALGEAARDRYLVLHCNGQQRIEMLSTIIVSGTLGTVALTLTFTDGGRFVPEDDAAFRQWWQQRHRSRLVHRLERHRRGVALTLLATMAGIAVYLDDPACCQQRAGVLYAGLC